jgi:hypothetical protein
VKVLAFTFTFPEKSIVMGLARFVIRFQADLVVAGCLAKAAMI